MSELKIWSCELGKNKKRNLLVSALRTAFLTAAFAAGSASGLVIYRFGGESLPPPVEVGEPGVEFKQVDWEDLDPDRQGEAFEVGADAEGIRILERDPTFNIAPTLEERGGVYERASTNGQLWDGETSSSWVAERYLCAEILATGGYTLRCPDDFGTPGTANITLGGDYLINRIRILSGLDDPARTARDVRIFMAPQMPDWHFSWPIPPFEPFLLELRDNREQVWDILIPPHPEVGFVQVAFGEHNEDWEIHDIEIFAQGLAKEATYVSNIIDFERPMAWGELCWGGRRDAKAQVFIQTRSGLDDDPTSFFRFTGRGGEKVEVERADYNKLKLGQKAGKGTDQTHWTFWSAPYDFADSAGAAVVSLSPRQYLQFKVDFLSDGKDRGEVGFLELRASEPLASGLVGEVWPLEVKAGEQTLFTYALRPIILADKVGFDRLELTTASLFGEVEQVRIGDVVVEHRVEVQEPHRLEVSFPSVQAQDSGALVEVEFTAQVLRYGTQFKGRVRNSARPLEVPQRINAGDATDLFEGNDVSVATSVREQALLQVAVEPAVFTPNGDGVNDVVSIVYNVFEITGQVSVAVEIRDLSGRLVRQVYGGEAGIGHYPRQWNGRDEMGELAPPGIYLYRVSLDADEENTGATGILQMVY